MHRMRIVLLALLTGVLLFVSAGPVYAFGESVDAASIVETEGAAGSSDGSDAGVVLDDTVLLATLSDAEAVENDADVDVVAVEEGATASEVETTTDESTQDDYQPMEDSASGGALANSFRYQDGMPANAGIALARTAGNTWTDHGNGLYTCTDGTRVTGAKGLGIDVSSWQGSIDWKAVKNSGLVDYVIIRCGWGSDYASQDDSRFEQYVKGCIQYDIPFGIYLYSYAYNTQMALSEANHVLRVLEEAGLTPQTVSYPIYIDLENEAGTGAPCGQDGGQKIPISNSMLAQIATTFCSTIENAGYTPGVYANLKWWNTYLTDSVFDQWTRWVAQYNDICDYRGSYDMWQCMSDGSIPGISGNVDINFDFTDLSGSNGGVVIPEGSTPMYRMYNPNSGEHFYTTNIYERASLVEAGWRYEGIGWGAPARSSTPVYRLYNPNAGDHHYTMNSYERDNLVRVGWRYEGVGWYSDDAHGQVLYRLYNPNARAGSHHYTLNSHERDNLVRAGWRYEGYAWYAMG